MKNYAGFHIPKIWQNLKYFARSFHQAYTSYFYAICAIHVSKIVNFKIIVPKKLIVCSLRKNSKVF